MVGHNHHRILTDGAQVFCPSQTGTDGIAVRTLMAGDENSPGSRNQLAQTGQLIFVQQIDIHLKQFVRINTFIYQLFDAGYCGVAISCIGHTKPLSFLI